MKTFITESASVEVVRQEVDFAYAKFLPLHLRRFVAFYEYARESPQACALVQQLQELAFERRDFKRYYKLLKQSEPLASTELHWLIPMKGFPGDPIKNTIHCYKGTDDALRWFGVGSALACLEWKHFAKMQRQLSTASPIPASEGGAFWNSSGAGDVYALKIPWKNCTNDELTGLFKELIRDLRPPHFPEPKRAGRGGRVSNPSVTDFLKHLRAYRLNKRGYAFEDASRVFGLYGSKKGWKTGIRLATDRIAFLEQGRFFFNDSAVKGKEV
jgi:hypothetical protein